MRAGRRPVRAPCDPIAQLFGGSGGVLRCALSDAQSGRTQELIEDLIRCSVGFSEARSTSDTKALIWLRRMSTPVFCPGDIALVWIF
jgi:hypothetical protein